MKTDISSSTLNRLPIYLHYLKSLPDTQINVSATQIATALEFGEVQVRKDLASISCGGKPKVGYAIKSLISELESYLGIDGVNSAIIVGVGRLGQALMEYEGFSKFGLKITAGFDTNPNLIGKTVGNKQVLAVSEMEDYAKNSGVQIAIITTPASSAQQIADLLVQSGVLAIWNFSPTHIVVPDTVAVKNENLASSLAVLSQRIKTKQKNKK